MTSENVTEAETVEPSERQPAKAVDDRLIDELVSRAQAEGLQLTGEGGLLQQLTKRLLESALEGEIKWFAREAVPSALFAPSASVLDCVWPGAERRGAAGVRHYALADPVVNGSASRDGCAGSR